jgi:branched-chain amino acid transport system ATP-binding protein
MSEPAPLLELDRVSKRFGRVVIADGVSLSVRAGDAVGIVGPNGAGKTSLFGVISGDLAPDAGAVRLDGRDLAGFDAAAGAGSGSAGPTRCPGRSRT